MSVFLDYDQQRLDALLDTRRSVPDWEVYTDRFGERSEAVRARLPQHVDLRYGPHPRERLDLFVPAEPALDPPAVNVFFHGGYWRSSQKERYSYVAEPFLEAGLACAVVEYALIPGVDLDELIRQCRASIVYLHTHAAELGIDPDGIHVSGHSAGGQIVGMLMAHGSWDGTGLRADVIRGGCGISGLYDMQPIRLSYLNEVLGLDEATAARNSPVLHRPASAAPLIVAVGGEEGDEFLRQNRIMQEAWQDAAAVTPLVMEGHHHYSAVEALGDPESELLAAVLEQMRR